MGMKDALEAEIEFRLIELEELFEQGNEIFFVLAHGGFYQSAGSGVRCELVAITGQQLEQFRVDEQFFLAGRHLM